MTTPKNLPFQILQGIIYAMVVTLFVVWVALGSRTVAAQNRAILEGIRGQNQEQLAAVTALITSNTQGDRTIVCLLNVDPDKRSEKVTQACVVAAADGRSQLTPEELKKASG